LILSGANIATKVSFACGDPELLGSKILLCSFQVLLANDKDTFRGFGVVSIYWTYFLQPLEER
jgi:hypothetical protein